MALQEGQQGGTFEEAVVIVEDGLEELLEPLLALGAVGGRGPGTVPQATSAQAGRLVSVAGGVWWQACGSWRHAVLQLHIDNVRHIVGHQPHARCVVW